MVWMAMARLRLAASRCVASALLLVGVLGPNPAPAAPARASWVSTWSAAPDSAGPALPPQTLRQILRVSLGGQALRIRLSNEYGDKPLQVSAAQVARHAQDASVLGASSRPLTSKGRRSFTIGVGESVLTDPVTMKLGALEELAVSLYFAQGTGASTIHSTGMQTAYTGLGDDQTRRPAMRVDDKDDSRYFVTDVEVLAAGPAGAVVIVGDSTTDGVGSAIDSNTRWPDQLAGRLQADPALRHLAVINAGISGNRLLNDGLDPFLGPSTLKRFDRDALSKPGVQWVVLLQGINDITASGMFDIPQQKASAEQIIAAMQQLIERAHARGVRIMGATVLPRQGAQGPRAHKPEGEAVRLQVNAWIREGQAFDAIVDFDRVLRDPDRPDRQRADLNSGDFSHPNAAGYGEMARAVDLRFFRHQARAQHVR